MKRKNKLNFSSERKVKQKQTKAFIISFAAFVLVLGTVSVLIFMDSVNFNLGNLVQSSTSPVSDSTDKETVPVALSGQANILLIYSRGNGDLACVSLLHCNMDKKEILVLSVSPAETAGGVTLNEAYVKNGTAGLKNAVSALISVVPDRFIRVTESELKKIAAQIGDIPVHIPAPFSYKGTDFSLSLDAGTQSLTADMFCKYVQACDNTQKGAAVTALLNTLLTSKNIASQDKLFNLIVNNSSTDISVVDYTKHAGTISAYVQYANGKAAQQVHDISGLTEVSDE